MLAPMSQLRVETMQGAMVDRIDVNWRDDLALVTFFPSPAAMQIHVLRADGLTRLEVVRGVGASRLVKEARQTKGTGAAPDRVDLVMADGHTVRIEAARFTLDPAPKT